MAAAVTDHFRAAVVRHLAVLAARARRNRALRAALLADLIRRRNR